MDLPDIVQSTLGDESVAARVSLGGEDELLVTPTRTVVYRSEGLLSDETVDEYPHGAERIEVSEGRRKSKVTLDYGLDGEKTFAVPTTRLDQALHPVLAGVLNATGITDPGETVKQTFRFSELTVVVTSSRLVRHIGEAVWDEEYDEYHYDDVTDLDFEEGSVATSVVVTVGGRQERFKAPNDRARAVREGLVSALCAYHDVADLEALREKTAPDEEEETEDRDNVSFGDGPDPLSTGASEADDPPSTSTSEADDPLSTGASETDDPLSTSTPEAGGPLAASGGEGESRETAGPASTGEQSESRETTKRAGDEGFAGSGFESAGVVDDEVAAELARLRQAVETQSRRLERQEQVIERLIEELRQGR
ncbi:MAG: hypothetical protein ABEJ78_09645 [Haloferacaceae archaeon]